jgi:DNA primase
MIKQSTIDEVRTKMDTQEVLETLGVVFKKEKACCPFHNEKSASFHIWRKQNTYKCFGCGRSGDAITAVMMLEKKTFIESLEWLAAMYNITVEYDQAAQQEPEETKNKRTEMMHLVEAMHRTYEKSLHDMPNEAPVWKYLHDRGFTSDICKQWSIGFAPNQSKFITGSIINMGMHAVAVECGLLRTKEGNTWDFYRNRIIIPIYNNNGQITGFGGRWLPQHDDTDRDNAKYFNPCESLLYQKEKTWFGLDRAMKAINNAGFAYLVEGYFDVMSWHNAGACNTISACGTAITETQMRILKRYTTHVVLCLDGDSAGIKKTMDLINHLLRLDFKVEVLPLVDKMDPDEFARKFSVGELVEQ